MLQAPNKAFIYCLCAIRTLAVKKALFLRKLPSENQVKTRQLAESLWMDSFQIPSSAPKYFIPDMRESSLFDRAEGGEEISIDQYYNIGALSQWLWGPLEW